MLVKHVLWYNSVQVTWLISPAEGTPSKGIFTIKFLFQMTGLKVQGLCKYSWPLLKLMNVFWRWYIGMGFKFFIKMWLNSKALGEYFILGISTFRARETKNGTGGGKFKTKYDRGLQICPADLWVNVKGWEECLVGCWVG